MHRGGPQFQRCGGETLNWSESEETPKMHGHPSQMVLHAVDRLVAPCPARRPRPAAAGPRRRVRSTRGARDGPSQAGAEREAAARRRASRGPRRRRAPQTGRERGATPAAGAVPAPRSTACAGLAPHRRRTAHRLVGSGKRLRASPLPGMRLDGDRSTGLTLNVQVMSPQEGHSN